MGFQERRVKLWAKRATPHLESGERIQTGFLAQTGSWMAFNLRVWTFIATDRAILIVGNGRVQRLPRDVSLGKPTGLYHEIQLDRTYKVHRQYYPEILIANEALREMQARADPPESEQH